MQKRFHIFAKPVSHSLWKMKQGLWERRREIQGVNAQEEKDKISKKENICIEQEYFPTCACMLSCFSLVWLCDPVDCSPPGSSVRGILQARILEWIAMPSSMGSSWPRDWTRTSYISTIGRQVLYHWGATWGAHSQLDDQLTEWKGLRKRSFLKCFSYVQY